MPIIHFNKKFFLIGLCLAVSFCLPAQKYGWAKHFYPPGTVDPTILIANAGKAMAKDLSGNLYITGDFADTVDFDPGPGTFFLSSRIETERNQFVVKLNPEGNLIWTGKIGNTTGPGGGQIFPNAIAVGIDGAVYTTGYFEGTVDFDPGPGVANITTTATYLGNIFISKLNPNGSYAWTKVLLGNNSPTANQDNGYGIAVDDANNVYTVGEFSGTLDLDPGPAVVNITSISADGFLVKLNAAGNYVAYDTISTNAIDRMTAIVHKNGLLYTSTWSSVDAVITKYDLNLNQVWEKRTQHNVGQGGAWPWSLCVDDAGNTIMSGSFNGFVDFDPGPNQYLVSAGGSNHKYLCKWDRNGNFKWIQHALQVSYETNVVSDRNGDIYFTTSGDRQFNTLKYNYKGDYQWTANMSGSSSFVQNDIVADNDGNIFSTGYYGVTADFDPDPNIYNPFVAGAGKTAAFVNKISNKNHISGEIFLDINNDGIRQAGEGASPFRIINAQRNNNNFYGISTPDGSYDIYVDTGTYSITIPNPPPYYISSVSSHTASFASETGGVDSLNNFPIYPIPNTNDLSVKVETHGRMRPGREYYATVTYKNTGTTTLSGSVTLRHAAGINFNQSTPAPGGYTNPLITWNYLSLQPFETRSIVLSFTVQQTVPTGTAINHLAMVYPVVNDTTPLNNKDSVNDVIVGSFDPNDKSVFPAGDVSTSFICADSALSYIVRFQNTGNDTAFLVIVSDTMQNTLDIKSLEITGASHPYSVRIDEGKIIKFIFQNIMLPDSTENEPRSHGFISYRIKPMNNLAVGTQIKNGAAIFFDFNVAVLTNQTVNTVTAMQPATISISTPNTPACANSPVNFTAIAGNAGTAPDYQWQVNGANAGTNSPNFSSSTLINGDQVRCLLTGNSACNTTNNATSNVITVTISSGVVPSVSIAATATTICAGTSVTFTATPVNEGTAPTYQWQVNGVNAGTNSNTFTTSTLTNNAQVKLIMTSSLNCALPAQVTSNTITMTVTTIPVANAGRDTAICGGSSVMLQATGGSTYSWSPATGLNNPNIANPVASPLGTMAYVVTVSNGPGCFSKDTVVVSISPSSSVSVSISTPKTSICAGTTVTFTAATVNAGPNPVFQWQVNGSNTGSNSPVFTSSTLTNNSLVNVVLTSNAACVANPTVNSNVINITVDQLATPLVTANNRTFTVTNPDAAVIYSWQKMTNSVWVDVLPAATGTSFTATVANLHRVKAVKGGCTAYSAASGTARVWDEFNHPFGIYLYPNPSSGSITIDSIRLADKWVTLDIINVEGKILLSTDIRNKTEITIDVSMLKSGAYFAKLKNFDGTYYTVEFLRL